MTVEFVHTNDSVYVVGPWLTGSWSTRKVLARCIVQDDPEQAEAAIRLIEGRCTAQLPEYVGVAVRMDLVWVLTGAYRYEKQVVASMIHQILRTTELVVDDREATWSPLREFEAGPADFADCLIAHRQPGARVFPDLYGRSTGSSWAPFRARAVTSRAAA